MGRWLVLGGTRFLSWTVAATALARGHEVVCAARGVSGAVPDGATAAVVDRDTGEGLDALRDERFDAVVDVAVNSVPWVRDALAALGATAGHWTFVSSISVYADGATVGQNESARLLEPAESGGMAAYGEIKVASEEAVRAVLGERAFIVRAGLICGPRDESDRFGYWPGRFARGGRALVPDAPEQPTQIVDVRDLADWIVRAGEEHLVGTFDGSGPVTTLGAVLAEIAEAVGAADLDQVAVDPAVLTQAGVQPWAGPRSLPLWVTRSHLAVTARDTSAAAAAGLRCRPVADTARGALVTERERGPDRERGAGLTAAEEAELLAGRAPTRPPGTDHAAVAE